jgi:type III secretion protein V
VRSGALDPESARARRAALVAESNYYGAMDGAMKFVRGDAIAGLCIVAVNVVGGLAVGVLQRGLPLDRALHVYTTLTVGDGLLAQIPSLLNATAAGLVVTRIAEPEGLGAAVARQLGGRPVLVAAGGLLAGLGLLPGLPALAFVPVGGALAAGGLWRRRVTEDREPARLGLCVHPDVAGVEAAAEAAERLRREYGLDVPEPEVRVSAELPPGGWRIEVGGAAVARGAGAGELAERCAAAWRRHAGSWWGVQAVSDRLARLEETQPALVRAVVARRFDVPRLARLLQRLVAEDVPVRDLAGILESLADAPADAALRALRRGLAPLVTGRVAPDGRFDALLPSAELEATLRTEAGPAPDLLDDVLAGVRSALARHPRAALLVAPDVREAASALLHPALPDLPIVSAEELLPGTRAEPVTVVG